MRAAILREYGTVPELADHPEPTGPDVVEVLAAGMNPVDIRIATGTFPLERYDPPYVAGKEAVGRRRDGTLTYFEYAVKPFGAFAAKTQLAPGDGYPLPEGLDPALAVCLGVSGLAAWLGLEWRGGLQPGERGHRGRPPQRVQHHVVARVPGGRLQRRGLVAGERDGRVGAERGRPFEPFRAARGGDHAAGAQQLRGLYGDLAHDP